jgi:hypothetical protein
MAGYYLLNIKPTARDLLRPSSWGIFVPYAVLVLAYLGVQLWVRQEYGLESFYRVGWFNVHNFLSYLSLAVFPARQVILNPHLSANLSVNVPAMLTGSVLLALLFLWILDRGRRTGKLTVEFVTLTWFLAGLLPLSTFTIGAIGRDLYVAGPAWAILVGLVGVWCWDRVAGSWVPPARLSLAAVLIVAVVLASVQTISSERGLGEQSAQLEAFVSGLRGTYPVLPEGSTVLVFEESSRRIDREPRVGLQMIYAAFFNPLVGLYYDGVSVRPILGKEIPALEPGEYLYSFEWAVAYRWPLD